jgi:hypothetical protein
MYPNTILNLAGQERYTTYSDIKTNEIKLLKLPTGFYTSVYDIVKVINNQPEFADRFILYCNTQTKLVSIELADVSLSSLHMAPRLCLQLGFLPSTDFTKAKQSEFPPFINCGLPSHIFIYCDIIENVIVGDTTASLLRSIPIAKNNYIWYS